MNVVAIWTGISDESTSTKLARTITRTVSGMTEADVTEINLRTLASDIASMTVTSVPSAQLEEAMNAVSDADVVISVCPIYNGAPLGLHTLFFQLLDDHALSGATVILGGTGGTARHSLALDSLRPLMAYLKAFVAPTSIFAATDDWASQDLTPRITQAVAEALRLPQTERGSNPNQQQAGQSFVPLGDLLGDQ